MAGFYWQTCVPGCLPNSDPFGPFKTADEAEDNATDQYEMEEIERLPSRRNAHVLRQLDSARQRCHSPDEDNMSCAKLRGPYARYDEDLREDASVSNEVHENHLESIEAAAKINKSGSQTTRVCTDPKKQAPTPP